MGLPLTELIAALESLAPLRFAEDWDNVGLLVDPRAPGRELEVERALLTIDATAAVLAEARERRIQCLIAYHPPLFQAARRFSRRGAPALFEAVEQGYAIYSPHTALDSAPGGLNDWLASGVGPGRVRPLSARAELDGHAELKLVVFVPSSHADAVRDALSDAGAGIIGAYRRCSFGLVGEGTFFGDDSTNPSVGSKGEFERVEETRLEMVCPRSALAAIADALARAHPYEEPAWDVYALEPRPLRGVGGGRAIELDAPTPLPALIERLKIHLGVRHLRVARSPAHADEHARVTRVAVAAGAGGSVLAGARDAELWITGELRHHDILSCLARGTSVIVCEHTNSERGYLNPLASRLREATGGRLELALSSADHEPLEIA